MSSVPSQISHAPTTTTTTVLELSSPTTQTGGSAPLPPPSATIAEPERIRDVVYLGVGSATAYTLAAQNRETLAQRPDDPRPYENMTIVGERDAWDPTVRGPGYINHQTEIIAPWSENVPDYDPNYADRGEFAAGNRSHIDAARHMGAEAVATEASLITRDDHGVFQIHLDNGETLQARRVVVATGAGQHTQVGVTDNPTRAERQLAGNNHIDLPPDSLLRERIMDLDSFMVEAGREPERFRGLTIAVHGPNAGIDAAERVGELGARLLWLTRNSTPPLLEGNHLQHAPEQAPGIVRMQDLRIGAGESGAEGRPLALQITPPGDDAVPRTEQVDFYVYALGQDAQAGNGVATLLQPLMGAMEPRYDTDQIYGDAPYQTVLGFQTAESNSTSGLTVIGAAASALAPSVRNHSYVGQAEQRLDAALAAAIPEHADSLREVLRDGALDAALGHVDALIGMVDPQSAHYVERQGSLRAVSAAMVDLHNARQFLGQTDDQGRLVNTPDRLLGRVVNTEVASVLQPAQLGAVRGTVAALEAFIPGYVQGGEANFTADNRTMLRAFIAEHYPNIGNEEATQFIDEVVSLRRQTAEGLALANVDDTLARLIDADPDPELMQARLMSFGVTAEAAEIAGVALAQGGNDNIALARDVLVAQAPRAVPAWGTPQEVRDQYLARLDDLNRGQQPTVPLTQLWG